MTRFILAGMVLGLATATTAAQTWTDISTALISAQGINPDYPGGCSGVVVNRLTGDLVIRICGFGLWKSTDRGVTYARIDNNTVSGRDEAGTALQVDQNDPRRIAAFSLDGTAGFTTDGVIWKKMADMGRNWDFGAVDWGTADVKVMLVAKHEDGGKVFKTTDGGTTWNQLNITVNAQSNQDRSMLGVMDPTTFIYCSGNGIHRSTDAGATWAPVSSVNACAKYPVLFKGLHYLGTATGLLVSSDKGATWHTQGTSIEIIQGPYFGATENTMVVVNALGHYRSNNAGTTWTKIADLHANTGAYNFDPKWWGSYAWDPVNNLVYASSMSNPVYKYAIATVAEETRSIHVADCVGLSVVNGSLACALPFTGIEIESLAGVRLFDGHFAATRVMKIPKISPQVPAIVRVETHQGYRSSILPPSR